MVRPAGELAAQLEEPDGSVVRLALALGTEPLAYLDGHIVQVAGTRLGRRVKVDRWTVVEGLSGMPVYVGVVQRTGSGVGLVDRTDGFTWVLDERASSTLAPWIGKVVLVEGYATGERNLTATGWRPLDD